jgi:hypothetical protein
MGKGGFGRGERWEGLKMSVWMVRGEEVAMMR